MEGRGKYWLRSGQRNDCMGFDAEERMERVYQRESQALLKKWTV
jgi:hypothetical protein